MPTTGILHVVKYLKLNYSRAVLSHVDASFQSGSLIMWFTTLFKEKILKYWVDCALHEQCTAPPGSTLHGCKLHGSLPHEAYAQCHRYDQSSINMIIIREFGLNATRPLLAADKDVFEVERQPTSRYMKYIKKC